MAGDAIAAFGAAVKDWDSQPKPQPPSDEQIARQFQFYFPKFATAIECANDTLREENDIYFVGWQQLGRHAPLSPDPLVYAELIMRGKVSAEHTPFLIRRERLHFEISAFKQCSDVYHGMFGPQDDDALVKALAMCLRRYFLR